MVTLFYISLFMFFGLCFLLSFFILIQESKSMGLGASFGGDVGGSVFGTSTADIMKKITKYLAIIFFVTCLVLSYWSSGISHQQAPLPTVIEGIST